MPSEAINESTRREWRALGFFYDRDDAARSWRIVGTAHGLRKFAQLIAAYASEPKHEALSEHRHFGPYLYLEVGTWSEPEITDHWIAGPLSDLASLARSIDGSIASIRVGGSASLRATFAPTSPYDLVLELRAEPFDPAREDTGCW